MRWGVRNISDTEGGGAAAPGKLETSPVKVGTGTGQSDGGVQKREDKLHMQAALGGTPSEMDTSCHTASVTCGKDQLLVGKPCSEVQQ